MKIKVSAISIFLSVSLYGVALADDHTAKNCEIFPVSGKYTSYNWYGSGGGYREDLYSLVTD